MEPWFPPDAWKPGTLSFNTGETPDGLVCRMALSRRQDQMSVISLHYLHGTRQGVRYYTEQLNLGLFTREQMAHAFDSAGMTVAYEQEGLIGRDFTSALFLHRVTPGLAQKCTLRTCSQRVRSGHRA